MVSNIEEVTYLRQYPNIFLEQLQGNTKFTDHSYGECCQLLNCYVPSLSRNLAEAICTSMLSCGLWICANAVRTFLYAYSLIQVEYWRLVNSKCKVMLALRNSLQIFVFFRCTVCSKSKLTKLLAGGKSLLCINLGSVFCDEETLQNIHVRLITAEKTKLKFRTV